MAGMVRRRIEQLMNPRVRVKALLVLRAKMVARGSDLGVRFAGYRLARWGVHIHRGAVIEGEIVLPHPVSIVVGNKVVLEDGVVLYQNVTLGVDTHEGEFVPRYPRVGRGARIYSGASVLGPVDIGPGAVVGAGSVVLHDVPAGATVVGAPARVVKEAEPSPDQP